MSFLENRWPWLDDRTTRQTRNRPLLFNQTEQKGHSCLKNSWFALGSPRHQPPWLGPPTPHDLRAEVRRACARRGSGRGKERRPVPPPMRATRRICNKAFAPSPEREVAKKSPVSYVLFSVGGNIPPPSCLFCWCSYSWFPLKTHQGVPKKKRQTHLVDCTGGPLAQDLLKALHRTRPPVGLYNSWSPQVNRPQTWIT